MVGLIMTSSLKLCSLMAYEKAYLLALCNVSRLFEFLMMKCMPYKKETQNFAVTLYASALRM